MMTIDAALAARLDAARVAVEAAQDARAALERDLFAAQRDDPHMRDLFAALREAHRIVDALADEAEAAARGGDA